MTEYLYVGRRRRPVRVLVYQLLTLGIYGRVLLYKTLGEFDGHQALFLDRRPYIPLLILPIVGPFLVKRRVARLLEELVRHDVTAKRPSRRRLFWASLIPLAPWFHWMVVDAVNHHWKMHTKEEEVGRRQAQLLALERKSRSQANLEAAAALRKDVAQRQKELDDLRAAALALHEAETLRRQAEREMRGRGLARARRGVGMVRKMLPSSPLRRRTPGVAAASAPDPEPPAPEAPVAPGRTKQKSSQAQTAASQAGPSKGFKIPRFLDLLRRRPSDGASREERKAAKARAKEEKRAKKAAAKEAKLAQKAKEKEEKARAKAEKASAKAEAKADKARKKDKAASDAKKPGRDKGKRTTKPKARKAAR